MSTTEKLAAKLASQEFLDPSMMTSALEFWFTDHDHIRSPFAEYMRKELAEGAAGAMLSWTNQLKEAARKEINQEMLAEKFEEILFDMGLRLAKTEDEKISIQYPFMPRLGDVLDKMDQDVKVGTGMVTARRVDKREDSAFLIVSVKDSVSGETSDNEFELPE